MRGSVRRQGASKGHESGAELWLRRVSQLWSQDAPVNQLIVLLEGSASVTVDEEEVGIITATRSLWWPDVPFGAPSPATVTTLEPCRVLVLTRAEAAALDVS